LKYIYHDFVLILNLNIMKRLFIAFVLLFFGVEAFAEIVDILGDVEAPKNSTRSYIARTSAYDPNYLYNWSISGGTRVWNSSGSEIEVKWGSDTYGHVRVHCIVQYQPNRTCDGELTVHLVDGVATVITTSPFGELCMAEPNVLERYIPSCSK